MICKLCLQEKKLIRAHIIPDFFYRNLGLYIPDSNGQGRVHKAEFNDKKFYSKKSGLPTGIYDTNILCKECDNLIGVFEDYAKKVLFDGSIKLPGHSFQKLIDKDSSVEYAYLTGLDYHKFKLFMISIFWRASISNLFSGIKLEPTDEEIIRLMILENSGKEEIDYAVVLFNLNDPQITSQIITDIKPIIKHGVSHYAFIAGGLAFYFYPKSKSIPSEHYQLLLTKNGNLVILQYPGGQGKTLLNDFYEMQLFK